MNSLPPKTLLRLNASPYQREPFFRKEKELAESWNLNYLFHDMGQGKLKEELPSPFEGPYIIISNTHTRPSSIPQKILDQTKFWIHSNSGYDNFSASWVKDQKFPIFTGNPIRKEAVAEYILGHLFSHFSTHPHQESWSKERVWERELLKDQSVLILGKGLIGELVGQCLLPLVHKLSYWDPFKEDEPHLVKGNLDSLMSSHRIIISTASLNPTSLPLLNAERIDLLPDNFIFINPARGGHTDQDHLIKRLKKSPKAFAYLDVFKKEPFESEFKGLKNVHLTSHIAGVFKGLEERILQFESDILRTFFTSGEESMLNAYSSLNLANRIQEDYLI